MRQINVYNTRTQSSVLINDDQSTTWGQLKNVLRSQNVHTVDLKAIDGETEVTYESDDAVIPTTDFTIFLVPEKVKSGADYWQIRSEIAEIINVYPEAKQFFNEGKNYTNKTLGELETLLEEWKHEDTPASSDCDRLEQVLINVRTMILTDKPNIVEYIDESLSDHSASLHQRAQALMEKLGY